jgi:phytoene desaturase
MLLGVDTTFPELAHHNIFFSPNYRAEFKAIFKDQTPPHEPTIYVSITSKANPDHAPDGAENWFVLINAPPLTDKVDWDAQAAPYRDHILARLAEFGIDARPHIVSERILTPRDLEHMSGAWRGALYGPSANSKWTVFRRPHNRSNDVQGLYFAGGTTHPGGGVPMVTLSGKVAADMILADQR